MVELYPPLTRDGTAEPVSRDQILRHARGQGNIHFTCSADHEQDWQPCPVDPYSAICDDHTYIIHTCIHTYMRGVTKRTPLGGGIEYPVRGWTSLPQTKLIPAGVSKNISPGGALLMAPPPKKGTYYAHPLPPLSLDCSKAQQKTHGASHETDTRLDGIVTASSSSSVVKLLALLG